VNRYYLTINTVLLAAIGLSVVREQIATTAITHQLVPFIGLGMAISWWFTVRSYNKILEVKLVFFIALRKIYRWHFTGLNGNSLKSLTTRAVRHLLTLPYHSFSLFFTLSFVLCEIMSFMVFI